MKKNLQYYIPFVFLLFLCFLCLEQIKLSFEINRLNSNHQNLIIEYENFKDTNIKLLTQFHSNNSPATIEKKAIETLGMIKKKPKKIIKKTKKQNEK
jgi:cell division protein FtsL|tara:strand:+ start:1399 stop:1689 length:291 start_codon:yes stop_codon:yes gene_type:complete